MDMLTVDWKCAFFECGAVVSGNCLKDTNECYGVDSRQDIMICDECDETEFAFVQICEEMRVNVDLFITCDLLIRKGMIM
jgi:hypothetical protein